MVASARASSAPSTLCSMTAPLTSRVGNRFAASSTALAPDTASPAMNAMAVGPSSSKRTSSRSASVAAILVRVFFTTANVASWSRRDRRSSVTSFSVMPRKSANIAPCELLKRSVNSLTFASFWALGMASRSSLLLRERKTPPPKTGGGDLVSALPPRQVPRWRITRARPCCLRLEEGYGRDSSSVNKGARRERGPPHVMLVWTEDGHLFHMGDRLTVEHLFDILVFLPPGCEVWGARTERLHRPRAPLGHRFREWARLRQPTGAVPVHRRG